MDDFSRQDIAAPIWRRIIARVIDTGFSFILYWPVGLSIGIILIIPFAIVYHDADSAGSHAGYVGGFISLVVTFVLVEWVLLVKREGQTPGKGLMGIRVVRVSKRYEATETSAWGYAFARMLFMIVFNYALSIFGWMFNLACVLCNRPRRAIHDFAAGTRVVMAPRRPINLKEDLLMALLIKTAKRRSVRASSADHRRERVLR